MKKSTKVICLASLLLGIPGCVYADRAHDLAKKASQQRAATGCNPASLNTQTCHAQFSTGCTDSAHRYDAYLNFLKNQTPGASLASSADLGDADFKALEGRLPNGLSSSNHARSAPALANLGEGNIVTVIAYLYFVEDTSKGTGSSPSVGETTNCKLQLPDSYDYHIGLGFDPALAKQILNTKQQPIRGKPGPMDKTSVVAEMTPHTRGPKWTFARVNSLQGQQVKVVGQLMIDNVHLNVNDDCGLPGALASCWRSTVGEIHPVTQFYVCNLKNNQVCDKRSPDTAWTSLDNLP
jgi:hypothetical protein